MSADIPRPQAQFSQFINAGLETLNPAEIEELAFVWYSANLERQKRWCLGKSMNDRKATKNITTKLISQFLSLNVHAFIETAAGELYLKQLSAIDLLDIAAGRDLIAQELTLLVDFINGDFDFFRELNLRRRRAFRPTIHMQESEVVPYLTDEYWLKHLASVGFSFES